MERHKDEFERAGVRVVAVGIGEPKHAQRYCPQLAPSLECVVSQDTQAHRAYGLKRGGLLQLAAPQVFAAGARAAAAGHRQGETTGDPALLSGAFIIGTDGVIVQAFYSRFAGDHPETDVLLAALGHQLAPA